MNPSPLRGRMAILVFACFGSAYFLSYALRSVNAVIAPSLTEAFGLSNAELGSLSSAYFFAFALMQLPLGIWLDRYGSRRVNSALLLVAATGAAIFASASGVEMLWVGRALIGVGVAGGLMSALKGYRFWYSPMRLQQLTAWMLVVGTAGALAVTVPVQLALPTLGWRGVFWLAALLLLVASALIWTLVPRDEEQHSQRMSTAAATAVAAPGGGGGGAASSGYAEVFRDGYFWRFAVLSVIAQGCFVSLQTLWAGPWFVEVLGMSAERTAEALFVFNLALMGGFFVQGWLVPRLERAGWSMVRYAGLGMIAVLAIELAIALSTASRAWLLWPLLAVASTFFTALQTHVSLSFRPAITGRVFTAYNLMIFAGTFLNQWLFGVSIDLFEHAGQTVSQAFRSSLMVWLVLQLGAVALLVFSKAAPPVMRTAQPAT